MTQPRIKAVTAADEGYLLIIHWDKGGSSVVDISDIVDELEAFSPLEKLEAFRLVSVGDFGWFVEWPEVAPDASLSADALWRRAQEQSGEAMPVEEFRAWRKRFGLSLNGAADALGLSRRQIAYYESGEKIIPKHVMLACDGHTLRHATKQKIDVQNHIDMMISLNNLLSDYPSEYRDSSALVWDFLSEQQQRYSLLKYSLLISPHHTSASNVHGVSVDTQEQNLLRNFVQIDKSLHDAPLSAGMQAWLEKSGLLRESERPPSTRGSTSPTEDPHKTRRPGMTQGRK